MNDIANKLFNKRTEMGISLNEVSEDLNYDLSQLEAIESGNFKSFKDVFVLKCIIRDYAKYLGFEPDEIIDEFNDFIFESTSKIPIDEIQKASKMKEKNSDDKIASPYTTVESKKNNFMFILIGIAVVLIVISICLYFYNKSISEKSNEGLKVSIGEIYEV